MLAFPITCPDNISDGQAELPVMDYIMDTIKYASYNKMNGIKAHTLPRHGAEHKPETIKTSE